MFIQGTNSEAIVWTPLPLDTWDGRSHRCGLLYSTVHTMEPQMTTYRLADAHSYKETNTDWI